MALSAIPGLRRVLPTRRAVAVLAAALVAAPLAAVAAPAQAAPSSVQLCSSMDTPVYLTLDPTRSRTLMTTSWQEAQDSAKHGYAHNLGVAMYAAAWQKEGLEPVYEMVRSGDGVRLYVMGDAERNDAKKHGFVQDSVAFYASPTANDCTREVVRFTANREGGTRYAQTANTRHREYFGTSWGNSTVNFFTRDIPREIVSSTPLPSGTPAPAPKPAPAPAPKPAPAPAPKPAPAPAPAPTPVKDKAPAASQTGRGAGATAVGSARYPVPSGSLFVSPSGSDSASGSEGSPLRTLEAATSRVRAGQTIVLRGGTYNSSVKFFVNDVTIQNYPGEAVWLDGTASVSGITKRGDGRYQAKWTHEFSNGTGSGSGWFAYVNESNKMAAWPDQVFVGGKQLWQVEKNPGPGEFARDYANDLIIFGAKPEGDVRASNKAQAMFLGGRDVTVQGIGIRRYAAGVKDLGMVYSMSGGLTMRNVVLEDAAANALTMGHSGREGASLIQDVTITRAGMAGINGTTIDKSIIERTLITEANWADFNQAPGGAGMKILRSRDIVIRDNDVRGTNSSGIWIDESVAGFRITNNSVTGGKSWGIMAELSGDGVIADNFLVGNSSGINVFNTHDTDVVNNVIDDTRNAALVVQQDERKHSDPKAPGHDPRYPAGKDPRLTWVVNNVRVTNNVFGDQTSDPWFLIQVRDKTKARDAAQMNVSFSGNGFTPRSGSKPLVGWGNRAGDFTHYATLDAWQKAQGNVNGNIAAPAGRSGAQLDDWAADNLPAVSWPSRARDYLGRGGNPGFSEIG